MEKGIVDYHPPKIPNNPQKQWVEHRARSKIMSFMICLKKPLAQHGVNHWRTSWIQNNSFDHPNWHHTARYHITKNIFQESGLQNKPFTKKHSPRKRCTKQAFHQKPSPRKRSTKQAFHQKVFSKKTVYKTSLSPKNILQENGHLPGPETSINQLHSATRKGVVEIRPNLWIFLIGVMVKVMPGQIICTR